MIQTKADASSGVLCVNLRFLCAQTLSPLKNPLTSALELKNLSGTTFAVQLSLAESIFHNANLIESLILYYFEAKSLHFGRWAFGFNNSLEIVGKQLGCYHN